MKFRIIYLLIEYDALYQEKKRKVFYNQYELKKFIKFKLENTSSYTYKTEKLNQSYYSE